MTIERSLSQVQQEVFLKSTKNEDVRTLTIPPTALKALQAHRRRQQKFRAHFGESYQGDFVFCNPDRSPLKPDTVSAAVSLLCHKMGLPAGVSLHSLRHSHGSHLLAAGVPLPDVSARLGHTDPAATAKIYSHEMPGSDKRAAKKWEAHRTAGRRKRG